MEGRLDILVTKAFEKFGDKTYLLNDDFKLSYKECHDIILTLQSRLIPIFSKYDLENPLLAILCDNKIHGILSILTCLISKVVYVPLDALAPIKRNLNIVEENEIPLMIISKSKYKRISKLWHEEFEMFDLPEINSYLLVRKTQNDPITYADLAYVLFTSGSTGVAKGIKIKHSNALAFINWSKELIHKNENQKFSSIAPFQFDLSVFDIYVSLLSGGSLFLFENEDVRNPRLLTELMDKYKIQIVYTTPTVYQLILSYGKINKRKLTSLTHIIFAGEVMTFDVLNLLKAKCQEAKYFNFYGPTETNVCTYLDATKITEIESPNVPIGNCCPFANYKIDKLDNDVNTGELLICGESVFSGYLKDPDLSNAKIKRMNGERWYATGDIVFEDSNGILSYHSRADRMIKYNGYRIELNEIESVILKLDSVILGAVLIKDSNAGKQIFAYVVINNKDITLSVDKIKNHCLEFLPHYMIPNSIKVVDQLPLNTNSKVDYKTLAKW